MKVRKKYIVDYLQKYFLLFFPFAIALFNPSKEIFGALSITDIFVFISILFFLVYMTVKKTQINYRFFFLILIFCFSFLALIVNETFAFFSTIKYQIRWGLYLSVFYIVYNYTNKKTLNYFIKGLFLITYFVCIYALLQFIFKKSIIPTLFWINYMPDYIEITFRAVGTFDNPLNLCAFLAFPLGILHFNTNKLDKKLLLLIYATLVVTVSKIGFILLFISFLVFLKKYVKLLIYSFLGFFIVSIIYLNLPQSYLNKSYIYKRLKGDKELRESVDTRIYMIKSSAEILSSNYIFGIGYENFEENYKKLNKKKNMNLKSSSYTSENFLMDFYLDNGFIPFIIIFTFLIECVLFFFSTNNLLIKQFSFSIILFIVIGLVMSSRTVPVMYLLFTYLAIIYKIKNYEENTFDNNGKLLF